MATRKVFEIPFIFQQQHAPKIPRFIELIRFVLILTHLCNLKSRVFLCRPIFRSYKPQSEDLKEGELPDAAPGEVTDKVRDELDREHEGVEIEQLVSESACACKSP